MSLPDDLQPDAIARALSTRRYGRSLRALQSCASTNDEARQDAVAGAADGHVVVADAQRSGRGSHGRAWSSPAGQDLYVSIVARPQLPLAVLPPLTLAVGLGVAECVERSTRGCQQGPPLVKWPNDVWLGRRRSGTAGRKCAGILVETLASDGQAPSVVIGVGLNVNRVEFPEELSDGATSLAAARGGRTLGRAAVLAELLGSIELWVDRFVAGGGEVVAQALESRLALRNERVRCNGSQGILLGVAASGAIRLQTSRGVQELSAGRLEPLAAGGVAP